MAPARRGSATSPGREARPLAAIGHSVLTVARGNLAKAPLVDPAGPVAGTGGTTPSGGGLHDDHDHEADAE